ncbi:MAG: SDR family NAD(P)-dependent oxidoreductase [Anaerolineae bacterium]|nr:SDR family NAD(P)-dependent oxidoreductase [Anaerolineae bacterium]
MTEKQPFPSFDFQPTWLTDKTALVTGGGRGIGKEICLALGRTGCRVALADIDAGAAGTADEIKAAGGEALFVQTDVADEEAVNTLKLEVSAAFGAVDLLVNNAIYCPVATVLSMDTATWDRVMAVNLRGTFLLCRAFIPAMLAQGNGVIINMVSTDAMPHLSAYIASKQGVAAFSQSLAGEVGEHGIKVIAFAPGFVDTPGLRAAAQGLAPHMGMDVEQFMGLSMHPAYPGAMPAADAALATLYLADRLAQDYHGEIVTGYSVLERAGVFEVRTTPPPQAEQPVETIKLQVSPAARTIKLKARPEEPPGERAAEQKVDPAEPAETSELVLSPAAPTDTLEFKVPPAPEPASGMDEATIRIHRGYGDLLRQLATVLDETETELAKLPVFVRPLAKQGFRGKAGLSLGDWKRLTASLIERPELPPPAEMHELLERLADYYRETPTETARFSKDAALLATVRQVADQRVRLIADLAASIG